MKYIFLIFIISKLLNCGSESIRYNVKVNSIGDTGINKKYVIYPGNKDVSVDDLYFKEYSNYLNRALIIKGFTPVSNLNDADIAIFFSYGIGEPKENTYSYNVPVWGQTGVTSSRTYGTIGSQGNFSSNTYYTPSYGITGSTTQYASYTTYKRFMLIVATDMKEFMNSKKVKKVWVTSVDSVGSSGDLRQVVPVMVVGSMPYLGKNSGKLIEFDILEDDQMLYEIKGIVDKE